MEKSKKMFGKILATFTALSLVFTVLGCTPEASGVNEGESNKYIINTTFDENISGWNTSGFTWTDEKAFISDGGCAKAVCSAGDKSLSFTNKFTPLEQSKYYIFTANVFKESMGSCEVTIDCPTAPNANGPERVIEEKKWYRVQYVIFCDTYAKASLWTIRINVTNTDGSNSAVYVDDIDLCAAELGDNMITNGDFEVDSIGPDVSNDKVFMSYPASETTCKISTEHPAEGSKCLRLTGHNENNDCVTRMNLTLDNNCTYMVSGWVRRSTGYTGDAHIDINFYYEGSEHQPLEFLSTTHDQWEYFYGSFSTYGHDIGSSYFRCFATGFVDGQYIEFDDVAINRVENLANIHPFPANTESLTNIVETVDFANSTNHASVTIADDKQYITSFGPEDDTSQYAPKPVEMPLIPVISGSYVRWIYDKHVVTDTDKGGKNLSITFNSKDEKYVLTSQWEMNDEHSPLEYSCSILCESAATTYSYADVYASDFSFKTDGTTTLYDFNRFVNWSGGQDDYFNNPVNANVITPNFKRNVEVWNTSHNFLGTLPYLMFDIDGNHGFYFGYEWSFGDLSVQTQDDASQVAIVSQLKNSGAIAHMDAGEAFEVPSIFLGAYKGDIDDGSNEMKDWFWDYEITRSLHDNPNEPDITVDWGSDRPWQESLDNQKSWAKYIRYYNGLEQLGFDVLKFDYEWTIGYGVGIQCDLAAENSWTANRDRFPNGMNLYSLVKNNSRGLMKLSLYMCNTYNSADLGTAAGVDAEVDALKERFNVNSDGEYGYDYWRSDFDVGNGPNYYDGHKGLLSVLDRMIEWSKTQDHTFHYEHCSGGGSLKDFTTLRRMTYMTTEDQGSPVMYRSAFYSASYMINPVQLRADLNPNQYGNHSREFYRSCIRSSMLGSSMIAARTTEWENEGCIDEMMNGWKLYNERQRAILRNGNVYHILAPITYSGGGNTNYKDWDGIQFYNDNIQKGSVFLFKERSEAPDEKTIKLKGLKENGIYNLEFEDRPELNCTMTGYELMNNGIQVVGMTEKYDSEIIWVTYYADSAAEKTTLLETIKKAETYSVSNCTDDSVAAFAAALNKAINVYNDTYAISYTVGTACADLENAMNGFVANKDGSNPYNKIEAETYEWASADITRDEDENRSGGGNTGGGKVDQFIRYGKFNFDNNESVQDGATNVCFNYSLSANNQAENACFEVRLDSLDGEVIGRFFPNVTSNDASDWSKYVEENVTLSRRVTGQHQIFILLTGKNGYVGNIDYFYFTSGDPNASKQLAEQRINELIANAGTVDSGNVDAKAVYVRYVKSLFDACSSGYGQLNVANASVLDNLVNYCNSNAKCNLLGDADASFNVTAADALAILLHTVKSSSLTEDALTRCDTNNDGRVNVMDALTVLRYSVGVVNVLGAK